MPSVIRNTAATLCVVLSCSLTGPLPVAAQVWINPATGDWFDPANWNPAAGPAAGSSPIVSNGGTATLAGVAQTPQLNALVIGSGTSGTGTGTVSSDGVEIRAGTFNVGTVFAGGSFADGVLTITGAGAQGSSANVGLILSPGGTATATGRMSVDGALPLTGGLLQVGQIFNAGRGSLAQGQLSIGGDAGTAGGFFIVGNVAPTSDAQVGSRAVGVLTVGGDLTLAAGTLVYVGTTPGAGSVVDGGNTFVDRAVGTVDVGGTLSFAGNPGFFRVGYTAGGDAQGSMTAGAVNSGGNQIGTMYVGASTTGQATGNFAAAGGDLRVGNLYLGFTNGGTAEGRMALSGMTLAADNVLAGSGAGATAHLSLFDSTATVFDQFRLLAGELSLDNSLMSVGNVFTLGDAATLRIDIDGLLRGDEYGAIDAGLANLAGALAVDFTDFLPVGDTMVFDLLRSGGADGILGDFGAFFFTGLQAGYSVFAGVELDGVEVYRLRVTRQSVPEPATWALVMACLLSVSLVRAAQRTRCPSRTGR
jgi:hypothetical protein